MCVLQRKRNNTLYGQGAYVLIMNAFTLLKHISFNGNIIPWNIDAFEYRGAVYPSMSSLIPDSVIDSSYSRLTEGYAFSLNGLHAYFVCSATVPSGENTIQYGGTYLIEYSMSSAWDRASLTYVRAMQLEAGTGSTHYTTLYSEHPGHKYRGPIQISPDGLHIYGAYTTYTGTTFLTFMSNALRLYQYDLSTPYSLANVSARKYSPVYTPTVNYQKTGGFFLNDTGTTVCIGFESNSAAFHQVQLTSPWDISTMPTTLSTEIEQNSIAPYSSHIDGIFIRSNGLQLFISRHMYIEVYEPATTAWDFSDMVRVNTRDMKMYTSKLFFNEAGTVLFSNGLYRFSIF